MSFNSQLIPYAFALFLALPFFMLLRYFVFSFVKLKNKEIAAMKMLSSAQIRLNAYERMTLFLERIKPSGLIGKFNQELAIHEYVFLLEKTIHQEFDYNSSQQIYLSPCAWESIVTSKNNVLHLIRTTYESTRDNTSLKDFKMVLLMNYMEGEDYLTQTIDFLRKETLLWG